MSRIEYAEMRALLAEIARLDARDGEPLWADLRIEMAGECLFRGQVPVDASEEGVAGFVSPAMTIDLVEAFDGSVCLTLEREPVRAEMILSPRHPHGWRTLLGGAVR